MKTVFALTVLLGLNFAAIAGETCSKESACSEKKECTMKKECSEKKECSKEKVCEKTGEKMAEKTEMKKN